MSRKSAFKNPFAKAPEVKPRVPRELKEIEAEYAQTSLQAGQAQYQAYVYQAELDQLNVKLLSLNREAADRNNLNKEAEAKEEAKKVQETNVQS